MGPILGISISITILTVAVVIFALAFMAGLDDKPLRAEREAEETVCREMAGQVLSGEASRFDYMATRCSARFLVPAEEG